MNSSVTFDSETSVMSSSCFEMRVRSRSNGPSNTLSETRKPDAAASASWIPDGDPVPDESSGDGATGDQLPREAQVGLGRRVLGRELGDRHPRDRGIRELDRPP